MQLQGQDGVDLEMNINGSKSTFELEDDEFEDVVRFLFVFTYCRLLFIAEAVYSRVLAALS